MKVYTVRQVAEILQLEYHTVLKLINNGFLPSIRVNRTHRISEESLKKFISAADKGESVIYEVR